MTGEHDSEVVAVGRWRRWSTASGVAMSVSQSTVSGGMVGLDLRKKAIFSLNEMTSGWPRGVLEFLSL